MKPNRRVLSYVLGAAFVGIVVLIAYLVVLNPANVGPKPPPTASLTPSVSLEEMKSNLPNVTNIMLKVTTPYKGKKPARPGFPNTMNTGWIETKALDADEQKRVSDLLAKVEKIAPFNSSPALPAVELVFVYKSSAKSRGMTLAPPASFNVQLEGLEAKDRDAMLAILREKNAEQMDRKNP